MYIVSGLAREAGSTTDAGRHDTDIGLLHPHRDRDNNYRRYSQADLSRLGFIRATHAPGFSLDDMQRLLAHWRHLPDCVPTGDSVCHLIEAAVPALASGKAACCHV